MQWRPHQGYRLLSDFLTQMNILRLLDFSKPFIVQTDGTDTGILILEFDYGRFLVPHGSKDVLLMETNHVTILFVFLKF